MIAFLNLLGMLGIDRAQVGLVENNETVKGKVVQMFNTPLRAVA